MNRSPLTGQYAGLRVRGFNRAVLTVRCRLCFNPAWCAVRWHRSQAHADDRWVEERPKKKKPTIIIITIRVCLERSGRTHGRGCGASADGRSPARAAEVRRAWSPRVCLTVWLEHFIPVTPAAPPLRMRRAPERVDPSAKAAEPECVRCCGAVRPAAVLHGLSEPSVWSPAYYDYLASASSSHPEPRSHPTGNNIWKDLAAGCDIFFPPLFFSF